MPQQLARVTFLNNVVRAVTQIDSIATIFSIKSVLAEGEGDRGGGVGSQGVEGGGGARSFLSDPISVFS